MKYNEKFSLSTPFHNAIACHGCPDYISTIQGGQAFGVAVKPYSLYAISSNLLSGKFVGNEILLSRKASKILPVDTKSYANPNRDWGQLSFF
jgi:hypothetical protein